MKIFIEVNLSLLRIFIREYAEIEIINAEQKVKTFDFSININFMCLYSSQKQELSSLFTETYQWEGYELRNIDLSITYFSSKKLNK